MFDVMADSTATPTSTPTPTPPCESVSHSSSTADAAADGQTAASSDETPPSAPIVAPASPRQRVNASSDGEAQSENKKGGAQEGEEKQEQEEQRHTSEAGPNALSRVTSAPTTKPPLSPTMDKESRPRPSTSSLSLPHLRVGKLRNRRISVDNRSVPNLKPPTSGTVPSIVVDEVRPSSRRSERMWNSLRGRRSEDTRRSSVPAIPPLPRVPPFQGITLDIPTGSFEDITAGFDKKKNNVMNGKSEGVDATIKSSSTSLTAPQPRKLSSARRVRSSNSLAPRPRSTSSRVLSADEDRLSQKVRLMYEMGDENLSDADLNKLLDANNEVLWEEEGSSVGDETAPQPSTPKNISTVDLPKPPSIAPSTKSSVIPRDEHELAGGIEDWQDIKSEDVDRYGFIIPRRQAGDPDSDVPQHIQRVSTSLMLAAATPRRKLTMRRAPSSAASIRSFSAGRPVSRRSTDRSERPVSSQSVYQTNVTRSASRIRQAANRLPHNRDRRLVDEAAYMLTLPVQFGDSLATTDDDNPYALAMKKKEWEREEKWRKMAKLTSKSHDGSGMIFEFDMKSTKLIERTWKGIPDRWRAAAWYAFLTASAKKRKDSPTDEELIRRFHELQDESSPDDVQIDIDVPRTISHHIMFRRRYRGGQRLLFRVLHAMSLYFPETGYVQGMASLAATLLSYYDEEKAFVMLVRLWQLRGLNRLYRSGFSGLMEALDKFEKEWLDGGEVAEKLNQLDIAPTAYATRWYLTLFSYSIPFPAQLRVWDVFMLLGDSDEPCTPSSRPETGANQTAGEAAAFPSAPGSPPQPAAPPFGKSLDVLHAASAALIDGMRDIILESDFENAMKVLTSWVPIKDIEMFMRVARAEWKVHCKKKGSS
ncbi:hypothetical protein VTO42DRAFT_5871 [Malbranchea cinnamomea]